MHWRDGYIAVDWGTTNRRAYRVASGGHLTDQFEDDLGVTSVPSGGFDKAVSDIRAWLGDLPMLMAGMVGSNRGWREAAYVPCPAGIEALGRAILWVEPGYTGIVPGLCQQGNAGADVMRGEEVQILGAIATGMAQPEGLICHPGTHAKWIVTSDARIAAFQTIMTGEVFALLSRHSILSDRLSGDVETGADFERGVDEGLSGAHMVPKLFGIRARHLLGEGSGDEASYLSGLLIGGDVRAGLSLSEAEAVTLIGRADLCALYAVALAKVGRTTPIIDGATAFLAGIRRLTEIL